MINGLIGRILMQDIHPDGFKQIAFKGFNYNIDEINKDLLDQIVDQSYNLNKLTINDRSRLYG